MSKAQRPAQGLTADGGGRPRDEDILTRKPLTIFQRLRWLVLFAILWFFLVWAAMADDPLIGFSDAVKIESQLAWWVFVLFGLELAHQAHYLISEHSARYNQYWMNKVWGRTSRLLDRKVSPWTRFNTWRISCWVFWIAVVIFIISKFIHTSPILTVFQLPRLVWNAMPLVFQLAFAFVFIMLQFVGMFWFLSRGGIDVYYPDDIKTRFADVWGQDHVLERVKENIIFLENPELVEDHGGYVPGGILLWGPPGAGKTLMAEAVAGETGKPYVFVDPGAFINMFFGIGVLKVKGLFRKLRKLSVRYGGVIVFFDEADSLGNRGIMTQTGPAGAGAAGAAPFAASGCHGFSYLSRNTQWMLTRHAAGADAPDDGTGSGRRKDRQMIGAGMGGMGGGGMGTLQALLTELSGLKKPRGFANRVLRRAMGMRPKPPPKYRILVMMATNMPDSLDPALLRPGRIDRIYRVGYPSKAGRVRTYEGYLDKVPHELSPEQIDKMAVMTPYATGASIKDLVNEALIISIRDGREVITWPDLIRAKQLKELGPPEDVEYIERERHAVAVHEACHAIVAYRTRRHLEIDIATIEKGSNYLGMVASVKPEDRFTMWRTEFESDILVSLASLAGERMFFESDSSSGVSGDLESATTTASLMEGFYGMGQTVFSYSANQRLQVGTPGGRGQGRREDPEDQARRALADRIEDNLSTLLTQAEAVLRDNERHVLALAHALETNKTLSGEDVTAVFEHTRGPLVDGTPYADDEFIARLRQYHAAAVRAHRDHGSPEIPLPAPVPALVPVSGILDGTAGGLGGLGNGNGEYAGPAGPADTAYQPPAYQPPGYGPPPDNQAPNGQPPTGQPNSQGNGDGLGTNDDGAGSEDGTDPTRGGQS
jgi:cell division protease FtsH